MGHKGKQIHHQYSNQRYNLNFYNFWKELGMSIDFILSQENAKEIQGVSTSRLRLSVEEKRRVKFNKG